MKNKYLLLLILFQNSLQTEELKIIKEMPMLNIIKQYDASGIKQALHEELPDFTVHSVLIIETGWDHLVAEINNEWIFRFPRTAGSIPNLEREKKLLDFLDNQLSLSIPQYDFVGKKIAFVGYRKIPGIHLSRQTYLSLTADEQYRVAHTLAIFFTELHAAVSTQQALKWGYTSYYPPLEDIEREIGGTLPAELDVMLIQAIAYAKKDLCSEENLVFFHKDLNGDNLAFNPTNKEITGIFDFSDAGIGPYSWEIGELFVIHEELAQLTSHIYAQLNGLANPYQGGAADYILRKATLLLWAQREQDKLKISSLVQELTSFLPVWISINTDN
jgi:aminoglycoside 2''-phosphotransferase